MADLLPVAFHGDTLYLVDATKAAALDTLARVETAEREANYA